MLIRHNIYYAKKAKSWNNQGVAFLDYENDGICMGRMYLITKEQYEDVKRQEGPWYDYEVYLGTCDNYPIFTFTNKVKLAAVKPSTQYLDVIRAGLKETYKIQ